MQFCKHCGAKLSSGQRQRGNQPQLKKKQPLTPKQKIIFSLLSIILVCCIGFGVWGNAYYSEEKTINRFAKALGDGNADAVQTIARMEGTQLSAEEASALAGLAEHGTQYLYLDEDHPERIIDQNEFFSITKADKKALLFFTRYQVEVEPQYVTVYSDAEGIKTTFNTKEFPVADSENYYTEYGPLAPGAYEARSFYQTDFGDAEANQTMILTNNRNEYDTDLEISYVELYLNNRYGLPYHSIHFAINNQEVEADIEDGYVQLGSMPVDGSLELIVVADTDWGEISIDPITITDNYDEIDMDLMNDSLKEDISSVMVAFSEGYVEAMASKRTEDIEHVTEDFRDVLDKRLRESSVPFSGSLDQVGISFADMTEESFSNHSEEIRYEIPVQLKLNGAYNEEEEPEEIDADAVIQLQYDTDAKSWAVSNLFEDYYTVGSDLEWYDASGEVYEAAAVDDSMDDESSEASDSSEGELAAVETVVENYVHGLVNAINAGDYSLVSETIVSGSDLDTMQKDLVERLYDAGMSQKVISVTVEDMTEITPGEWEVTTNEMIELTYESGETETEVYEWTYTVEGNNGDYGISNLE